jgi:lipid-binding SYLF domain-containing protein
MQRISVFSLALIALVAVGTVVARQAEVSVVETLQNATTAFQEMMANPEKAIPREILEHARCVVIVPHQSRAGVVGGTALRGAFTCRTGAEWNAPGFITLSSKQFQIGLESTDYVLVLMSKLGDEALSSGKFRLGADLEVAEGPVGRYASASTDVRMHAQVLTYSRSRGLFAGVGLTGGEVRYDSASTRALYGQEVSIHSILNGQVSLPPGRAREFVYTVSRGSRPMAESRPEPVSDKGESHIPAFPWPPPAASTDEVIPSAILEKGAILKSLGDVDAKLVSALRSNGYVERSYYAVPDGFALVTRLEQIGPDGTPKPPPGRWSLNSPRATVFTLRDYLRALFTADPGYYRVIVFIISDVPFSEAPRQTNYEETIIWLKGGVNVLPVEITSKPYSKTFASTVLIYEFEKDQGNDPKLNQPSRLDAHTHLDKSGLWSALEGKP